MLEIEASITAKTHTCDFYNWIKGRKVMLYTIAVCCNNIAFNLIGTVSGSQDI